MFESCRAHRTEKTCSSAPVGGRASRSSRSVACPGDVWYKSRSVTLASVRPVSNARGDSKGRGTRDRRAAVELGYSGSSAPALSAAGLTPAPRGGGSPGADRVHGRLGAAVPEPRRRPGPRGPRQPVRQQTKQAGAAIDQNGDAAPGAARTRATWSSTASTSTGRQAKKQPGEAAYLCYFNYDARALCMAYYELAHDQGTLVASGPVDFDKQGLQARRHRRDAEVRRHARRGRVQRRRRSTRSASGWCCSAGLEPGSTPRRRARRG